MPTHNGAVALFLVSVIWLGACDAPTPARLEALPGLGLGDIRLGAPRAEVVEAMGGEAVHSGQAAADTLLLDEWMLPAGQRVSVLYYQDRVIQIRGEGPEILTPQGISTQSRLVDIRNVFPNTTMSIMAHAMETLYLDDISQGIAFGAAAAPEGEAANPEGDAISIIVHEPGQEVIVIVHHH